MFLIPVLPGRGTVNLAGRVVLGSSASEHTNASEQSAGVLSCMVLAEIIWCLGMV